MATATLSPRIWGEWDCAFYGSGTTIVRLKEHHHRPWLYIYADRAVDESRYVRDRINMCYELCEYMNGGERPGWLNDFDRTTENCAISLAGGLIDAVGPMVDCDPPNLHWVWDESDEAVSDRAKLMDVVFLRPSI